MIKKVIIGLILLVCICSGAFSVMYHYNPTNNSDIDNSDSDSIIGNTNNEVIKSIENNPIMNYISNIDDSLEYVSEYFVANTMGMLEHYSCGVDGSPHLDYILFVNPEFDDSDDTVHSNIIHFITDEYGVHQEIREILPDKYYSCTECGKWIPANEITHPLLETSLCHCDEIGLRDSILRIDDIVVPVDNNDFTPVTGIYCNDCDGNVILNNYDDSKNLNSYFELTDFCVPISNICSITKLCSHHNGTLDLFNTHIENFHQGWFKSTEDYNHWLEEANKSLNENNTSIDNNVNETVSSADKNIIDDVVYHEDNETYIEDFHQDFDNEETSDKYVEDYAPDNKVEIIDLFDNCWVGS